MRAASVLCLICHAILTLHVLTDNTVLGFLQTGILSGSIELTNSSVIPGDDKMYTKKVPEQSIIQPLLKRMLRKF